MMMAEVLALSLHQPALRISLVRCARSSMNSHVPSNVSAEIRQSMKKGATTWTCKSDVERLLAILSLGRRRVKPTLCSPASSRVSIQRSEKATAKLSCRLQHHKIFMDLSLSIMGRVCLCIHPFLYGIDNFEEPLLITSCLCREA